MIYILSVVRFWLFIAKLYSAKFILKMYLIVSMLNTLMAFPLV